METPPSPAIKSKKRDHVPVKVKQEPVEEGKDGNVLAAEDFTHGGVRKAKFVPKIPTRRLKKLSSLKSESGEGTEAELSTELLKLVKQSQEDAASRGGRRTDIRAPTRVAFGAGSSVAARAAASFSKGSSSGGSGTGSGSGSGSGASAAGAKKSSKPSHGGIETGMFLDEKEAGPKKSTWDLSKYYPVTLPLQKPGEAELLEDDQSGEFEENVAPVADELGLMKINEEDQILFFQLPSFLPLAKAALTAPVKAADGSSVTSIGKSSTKTEHIGTATWLENMPAGHMGKLLVYRSGVVKLRLGDTLYEAVTGSECIFAQELVGINAATQHCCFLGDMTKKVIIIPCLDEILKTGSHGPQK